MPDAWGQKQKKPRVSGAGFLFLPSIYRIPSLDIKPAKYVGVGWLVSGFFVRENTSVLWAGKLDKFSTSGRSRGFEAKRINPGTC
jgi:hypothetical protein